MSETTAQASTRLLRTTPTGPYARLRDLLTEHGIDPTTDILADLFPDDADQEFGVVVTTARRVFTFVLHYGRQGDLKRQVADAKIGDWQEITERWSASPYRSQVAEALNLL